jgi:hypothetical protein
MPDRVHQVGAVLAVMDGEAGIDADLLRIFAQDLRADSMEGVSPGQRIGHDAGPSAQNLRIQPLDPAGHLGCGPPREGHQRDPARVGAIDDQMGHLVSQSIGLTRARTRDDEQRRPNHDAVLFYSVFDGLTLLAI